MLPTQGFGGFLSTLGQHVLPPAQSSSPISVASSPTEDEGNSPSASYVKKLEMHLDKLRADVQRLQREVANLNEDLKLTGKEAAILLSDEDFNEILVTRPFFREFIDKGLDKENKDLDELRLSERLAKSLRDALQVKLNRWKEVFGVVISLSDELQEVEHPKTDGKTAPDSPKSVSEIIRGIFVKLQAELINIFDQIEPKFRDYEEQIKRLELEICAIKEKDSEGQKLKEKNSFLTNALKKVLEEKIGLETELKELNHTLTSSEKPKDDKVKIHPLQEKVDKQAHLLMESQETIRMLRIQIAAMESEKRKSVQSEYENKTLIENYDASVSAEKEAGKVRNQLIASNQELRQRITQLEKNFSETVKQFQVELIAEKQKNMESEIAIRKLEDERVELQRKASDFDRLNGDYAKALGIIRNQLAQSIPNGVLQEQ